MIAYYQSLLDFLISKKKLTLAKNSDFLQISVVPYIFLMSTRFSFFNKLFCNFFYLLNLNPLLSKYFTKKVLTLFFFISSLKTYNINFFIIKLYYSFPRLKVCLFKKYYLSFVSRIC